MDTTDRFGIVIERQEQIERLIREWGFLPFFKNGIPGFSIEEMTPPELLFGDDFPNVPGDGKALSLPTGNRPMASSSRARLAS